MEAVKPGSTHDQWADPFPQEESRKRLQTYVCPPLSLSRPRPVPPSSTNLSSEANDDMDQSTSEQSKPRSVSSPVPPSVVDALDQQQVSPNEDSDIQITVRTPTPPPRSEISLRSEPYDPYIKANEVLLPLEKRNSQTSLGHLPMEFDKPKDSNTEPIYLKLSPQNQPTVSAPQSPEHHRVYSPIVDTERTSVIVAELETQFTPLEIDLLVKMLEKISTKAKVVSKQKERPKSADDSIHKEMAESDQLPESDQIPLPPSSDSSGYCRLADLMLNLDDLESSGVLSEQNILCPSEDGNQSSNTADMETVRLTEQHQSSTSVEYDSHKPTLEHSCHVPSRTKPGSLKEGLLSRQNAIRQGKGVYSRKTKPKEAVSHLSKFVKVAIS